MPYTDGTMLILVGFAQLLLLAWFVWTLSSINRKLGDLVDLTRHQRGNQQTYYNQPANLGPQPAMRPMDDNKEPE